MSYNINFHKFSIHFSASLSTALYSKWSIIWTVVRLVALSGIKRYVCGQTYLQPLSNARTIGDHLPGWSTTLWRLSRAEMEDDVTYSFISNWRTHYLIWTISSSVIETLVFHNEICLYHCVCCTITNIYSWRLPPHQCNEQDLLIGCGWWVGWGVGGSPVCARMLYSVRYL